ncbi:MULTISPECIES: hypothetical protein [unclassified Nocardia]|uniref:hypothetical protein n=1 Tax=unclassified Nocardia TaxID=2637762 RepID=UPI00260F1C6F|nr:MULTISPECIES: hypothetical protein [unclassified Nocardia]MCU1642040.1 hypothetical protein [Nocardia sp.]WSJ14818.1 hypothetical protein OG326_35615 [Nocardia sp. NBC_01327]
MPHSAASATVYVITALEATGAATRNDFDIPAIVTTTYSVTDTWDFDSVDPTIFWNIAATFINQ